MILTYQTQSFHDEVNTEKVVFDTQTLERKDINDESGQYKKRLLLPSIHLDRHQWIGIQCYVLQSSS